MDSGEYRAEVSLIKNNKARCLGLCQYEDCWRTCPWPLSDQYRDLKPLYCPSSEAFKKGEFSP